MSKKKLPIVLASASPRRKELLLQVGVDFEIIVPQIIEKPQPQETPQQYIERNSREKNAWVREILLKRKHEEGVVISADTIVVLDNKILEKPESRQHAEEMLTELSGRMHTVLTAYCITDVKSGKQYSRTVSSAVHFRKMDKAEIEAYVRTNEPLDKAGAYGAQGIGSLFVEKIDGSYSNVVGLPLYELFEDLRTHFHWQPF